MSIESYEPSQQHCSGIDLNRPALLLLHSLLQLFCIFGEDSFLKIHPNVPAKLLSFAFPAKFSLLKELIPNQGCRAKRVSIVEMPLIFLGTISSFSASRSIQRPVPLRFYSEKEAPHRLRKPVGSSSFQIIGGGIFMPTSRSTYPDGS